MAQNFELNEIEKVVQFCHNFGAKAYLTLNTIVNDKELEEIEGVTKVEKVNGEYIAQIKDKSQVKNVFKAIKNHDITKFAVEEPTLNEIFVEKVGESYEK